MNAKGARWYRFALLAAGAVAAGCAGDSTPLHVIPAEPSESRAVAGDAQRGTVGEPAPDSLVVLVLDRYSNPVPGVRVRFTPGDGAGTVSPEVAETGLDGKAYAEWTLGTRAGEHEVAAEISGSAAKVTFRATALPGAPAMTMAFSGMEQSGPAGVQLPQPLVMQATDAYGNGIEGLTVAWEVTEGDGSVDPATSTTDVGGLARTYLTLGSPGRHTVTARIAGLPDVTFRAFAGDPINLSIPYAYLVQSVQTPAGDVPLVAGRDAMLRVFVIADQPASVQPDVRVDFYVHGSLVASERLPAPLAHVLTAPQEGVLGSSWNLIVPGERIVPGLAIRITVDPDDEIFETNESDNTVPASGSSLPIDVRALSPFRVVFVPIRLASSGRVGDVSAANANSYLADALAMFPIPSAEASVHAVFTPSPGTLTTAEDWETVLSELYQLRVTEGASHYYYGVAPFEAPVYCGLGYVGYPVAMGLDVCGAATAAHEWGHNFGRRHAPCGDPSNPDPAYPYLNASIGVFGLDLARGEIREPWEYYDLMSYCTPEWISDYTYRAVLSFRQMEASSFDKAASDEPVLMLWGRIGATGAVLEPAYEANTAPVLPSRSGPYRLQGIDGAGGVVFELAFEPHRLGHGPDVQFFSFAVPVSMAQPHRLERLRLIGPGGVLAERVRQAAVAAAPAAQADPADPRRLRVQWNAAGAPLVVVRDPATGQVLSFARGGSATIRSDAREVEVIVSDGIGNRAVQRMRVR